MKSEVVSLKVKKVVSNSIRLVTTLVFLPILFCVIFIGYNMNYNDAFKPKVVLGTWTMSAIALVGVILFITASFFIKEKQFRKTENRIINVIIVTYFVMGYFINCMVAREIAFCLPWDIMVVQGHAADFAKGIPMGYEYYYSMYPNNVPITYLLGRFYRVAMNHQEYQVTPAYIYMQLNCLFYSLAGIFSCLSVKKLTRRVLPVVAIIFTYTILVWGSGWKIAPYTDSFAIVFPIVSVYLYLCAMETEENKAWKRGIFVLSSLLISVIGGFVKPNLYIVTIALIIMEGLHFIISIKKYWKMFLIDLSFLALLFVGTEIELKCMMQEIQLVYNPEISYDYNHYLMMGLNEETTGGYNSEDVGMIGQYQTSKQERIRAERQIIVERLKEKGFIGTIYFYLRKLTMTFNEGTFGWSCEVWPIDYYPEELASNTRVTDLLREIYWFGKYSEIYDTICQIVWLFAILGIPGVVLLRKKDEPVTFLCTCLLGIVLYQMLFEARARYLFSFLPILLFIAACGLHEYANWIKGHWKHRAIIDEDKLENIHTES